MKVAGFSGHYECQLCMPSADLEDGFAEQLEEVRRARATVVASATLKPAQLMRLSARSAAATCRRRPASLTSWSCC